MVGAQINTTRRRKETMASIGEMIVRNRFFMMFLLWPRVGEVEVNRLQGCFRNQVIQKDRMLRLEVVGCCSIRLYDFFDPSSERVQASALQQKN